MLLEVLQQHATGTVDDALGHAGRARAVEHVPGVVERQLFELLDRAAVRGQPVVPGRHRRRGCRCDPGQVRVGLEERDHHYPAETVELPDDAGQRGATVVALAAVGVAVGGHQHGRGDLAEPVEHAVGPEVRRGRREHCADRRGAQHDEQRLGDVRHPCRHPVARLHTLGPERRGDGRHLGAGRAPRELPAAAALIDRHQQEVVVGARRSAPQDLFGDVQPHLGEPGHVGQLGPLHERRAGDVDAREHRAGEQ